MRKKSISDLDPEQLRQLLALGKKEQEKSDDSPAAKAQTTPEVTASMFMDKTGSQIGPFRIEKELGRGGAGVVYLAHDTKLDRQVAIKSLPPELADNDKFQARFQREAKLLASLNHPNIASIYEELEESHEQKYIVMEYVPGITLRQKIAKGIMELKDALAIALDITDAMSAAHAKGVIHRDLKPENIKITPDGRTKLLDFGIAKMIGIASITASTLTESGHIVGTIGYMSPEQARGKSTDHRTDIWAVGCILYEMLTGKCAFSGDTGTDILASILKTDPDWQELPPETDATVRSIIERCLKKNADERYQSAEELLVELQECRQSLMTPAPKPIDAKAITALLRKPKIAAAVLLVLLMVIAGISFGIHRSIKSKWANDVALPAIIELVRNANYSEAFLLAREAEKYIPHNQTLRDLISEITCSYSINTNPPGAKIAFKEYSDLEGEWIELGNSPVDCNLARGIYRWMIEKPGYVSLEFPKIGNNRRVTMDIELYEEANSYPEMVLIDTQQLGRYWIDKCEVTNKQYKKFVDAGGYQDEKYWKEPFIKEGEILSFKDAMGYFLDKSNRPGPATWDGGTFGEGKEEYPVSGISWYEAAAYANYAGKSLPTITHWFGAIPNNNYPEEELALIIPFSNFSSTTLSPGGASGAMGLSGVYDMAGNVREWCYNATDNSARHRYILGGSWQDQSYMFNYRTSLIPWDRDQTNGLRCVTYDNEDTELLAEMKAPVEPESYEDFRDVEPVPNQDLERYIDEHYIYSHVNAVELKIQEEGIDKESSLYWTKQKITYKAAYGDESERIIAYLFLPKGMKPPYQPVIYNCGATTYGRPNSRSKQLHGLGFVDFMIRSGRAVLYPVYKGTYERRFPEGAPTIATGRIDYDPSDESDLLENRLWMIQIAMDLRRSVDYLETRPDMDTQKLTYCGFSWGSCISPIMLTVENRIKFAILFSGGFVPEFTNTLPQANPINFAPRVRCDVLMINGKNDLLAPFETSQKPMFDMLGSLYEGTANKIDKTHKPYPCGHGRFFNLPDTPETNVKEYILNWMDDHLGPVD